MERAAGRAIAMPMSERYLAIISGARTGIAGEAARGLLAVLSVPYRLAVAARNILYDAGALRSHRAAVPVVCVGNLSCGGTGKTPTVIALVRMLREAGHRPGISTRGYKGSAEMPADEQLLFARALPTVPVVAGGDRVYWARRAVAEHEVDVLVMDDGFGHRRLGRDLDIVLLGEPLEKVRLLPRGLYREPASSLRRAGMVIRTYEGYEAVSSNSPQDGYAKRQATGLLSQEGPASLGQLRGERVWAFCGIGNPASFERTLAATGAEVIGRKRYADHYRYRQADLDELASRAGRANCSWAVTTMKDWVKIEHDRLNWPRESDCRLGGLEMEMVFSEQTDQALRAKLEGLFAEESKAKAKQDA